MKVGTGQGESVPFTQRGRNATGFSGFDGNYSRKDFMSLKVGDGSSNLGYYLAVLATEYKLLQMSGQDRTKVVHELYCALNAINRLDYLAEPVWSGAGSENLNGYFIRDDIPQDFVTNNYAHFNYSNSSSDGNGNAIDAQGGLLTANRDNTDPHIYLQTPVNLNADRGFCSIIQNGMYGTNSDYQNWQKDNANNRDFAMSQDQVYALIVGLALTSALVDPNEDDNGTSFYNPGNFAFGGNQSKLQQEAKDITRRIINYFKNVTNGVGIPWHIKDPGGNLVLRGPDASAYSYPLSQAGCFIMSGSDEPAVTLAATPFNCSSVDPYSFTDNYNYNLTPGFNIFHVIDFGGQGGTKADLEGFYNDLAAVCNCLYTPVGLAQAYPVQYAALQAGLSFLSSVVNSVLCYFGCPAWVQQAIANIIGALSGSFNLNDTGYKLYANEDLLTIAFHSQGAYHGTNSSGNTSYGTHLYHGSYLHAILHGNLWAHHLDNHMFTLIGQAPCEGNYNFADGTMGAYEWSSDNRIELTNRIGWRGDYSQTSPVAEGPPAGEFNGIDFMLYHNLYYLYNGFGSTTDLSERKIDLAFPISSGSLNPYLPSSGNGNGSHSSPVTIGAFEFITADNTINSTGDLSYRAGKTIHLISSGGTQQFHVAAGANFDAYISPYQCNGGADYTRTTTNNDTIKQTGSYSGVSMFEASTSPTQPVAWSPPMPQKTTTVAEVFNSAYGPKLDSINTMIKSYVKATAIDVFPNPSSGKFTITNTFSKFNYSITDVVGNLIVTGQMANKNTDIDLSYCKPGVYFISIDDGNGNKQMKKIIIN